MITLGQARDYLRASAIASDAEVEMDITIRRTLDDGRKAASILVGSQDVADLLAFRYRECGWSVKVTDVSSDRVTKPVEIQVLIDLSPSYDLKENS